MRSSQFSILMSNLFIISSLLSTRISVSLVSLSLAFLWIFSSIYSFYLERLQQLKLRKEIAKYNKFMEMRFKKCRKK